MGDSIKVSVGLPVYNAEKYLASCLQCYVDQTYDRFEVIISDNGSTDGTEKICRDFAARHPFIRYYRQEKNQGAGWNYNEVLRLSQAPYFKWGAYDDLVSPEFLGAAVAALDADPGAVLSYGITVLIDADGKETDRFADPMRIQQDRPSLRLHEYLHKVRLTNAIYGVIRKDKLLATGGLPQYVSGDVVLLAELAMLGTFHELPGSLFYRRIHDGAYVSNKTWSQRATWFDPKNKGKLILPTWTHLFNYIKSIRRTPMSGKEKLNCYGVFARWERFQKEDLFAEAKIAFRVKLFGFPKEGY
jgi:glycosyltransferase involved in cell wall biosynthesis